MTLQEFINKYTGQYIEIDVNARPEVRNQCMDLFYFYQLDVLGFTNVFRAPTAYQAFISGHNEFHRIVYTSDMRPHPGDVIFWSDDYIKGTGHVAIFIEGDEKQFLSFDQNWPVGSNCHKQSHSYDGVVGWLRPKKLLNQLTKEDMQQIEDLQKRVEALEAAVEKIREKKISKKKAKRLFKRK